MSDGPRSALLHLMRHMDEKLDRVIADLAGLKSGVTAIEGNLAVVITGQAKQSAQLDRLDLRLERIEHRLGLVGSF